MAVSQKKSSSGTSRTNKKNSTRTNNKRSTSAKNSKADQNSPIDTVQYNEEIVLIVSLVISLLLLLSNFNLSGKVGTFINQITFGIFGIMAYIVPFLLFLGVAFFVSNKGNSIAKRKIISTVILFIIITALLQMITKKYIPTMNLLDYYKESSVQRNGGGIIGGIILSILCPLFDIWGTYIILVAVSVVLLMFITEKLFFAEVSKKGGKTIRSIREKHKEYMEAREENYNQQEEDFDDDDYVEYEEPEPSLRRKAKTFTFHKEKPETEGNPLSEQIDAANKPDNKKKQTKKKKTTADGYDMGEFIPTDFDNIPIQRNGSKPSAAKPIFEDELEQKFKSGRDYDIAGLADYAIMDGFGSNTDFGNVVPLNSASKKKGSLNTTDNSAEETLFPDITPLSGFNLTISESKSEYAPSQQEIQESAAPHIPHNAGNNEYMDEQNISNSTFNESDSSEFTNDEFVNSDQPTHNQLNNTVATQNWNNISANDNLATSNTASSNIPALEYPVEISPENGQGIEGESDVSDFVENEYPSPQNNQEQSKPVQNNTTYNNSQQSGTTQTNAIQSNITQSNSAQSDVPQNNIAQSNPAQTNTQQNKPTQANTTHSNPTQNNHTQPTSPQNSSTAADTLQIDSAPVMPKKEYKFPPIDLLGKPKGNQKGASDRELKETAMKLQTTLESFGVRVTITNVSCGPTVTRYELQPEQGVKVSKITNLADDIKLNLAAADIRIEAPIPGKAAVGIEVPNKENTSVMFRELIESEEFKNHSSNLAFGVGKDIGGQTVVTDIAKMPHLLIAGATGSGKSVCINTLIMSILYKANPEDVKLIMVDPKIVELSIYNGIPHLLIPVVTDPKKASAALNWAVIEMTDRYNKFAELGVRDIKGYNDKIKSVEQYKQDDNYKKMPQIVIIVDELADLMMVAPGEVEDAICRLAQMARAAGLHLIIATQRPSVNVITGLIKANVPSRIAFSVSSAIDSRTILDGAGAEKLLGKGDMLFFPSGYPKPVRLQGAFVSDKEVGAVVSFLAEQNIEPEYSQDIANKIVSTQTADSSSGGGSERDAYFTEAGKFIIDKDKASIGMLQRVYKVGFNRAARIMDQLYEAGVVGPEEGTKPRKVLMSMEEFEQFVDEYV